MDRITLFADVLLPLPLPGFFTYRVPFEMNDEIVTGQRVVVQFGQKKIYTAIVFKIHQQAPTQYVPKYILSVLDDEPLINELQMKFWQWISTYYLCNPGEVMNVALPSVFKLASDTKISLNQSFEGVLSNLNPKEAALVEALMHQQIIPIAQVAGIVEQKKIIPLIKTLVEKQIIFLHENIEEKYKPLIESYIQLNSAYQNEKTLQILFDQLEKRAFKQLEALMAYVSLSQEKEETYPEIKKSELTRRFKISAATIDSLIKKDIFIKCEKESSRLKTYTSIEKPENIQYIPFQQKALDEIEFQFNEKEIVLLHGITSSGKTEVYINLIDKCIKEGKQVLYLLPEIALTSQIINRLRKYFGNAVGIYHSKHSDNEKAEIWQQTQNNTFHNYQIILGARSAIFLPYSNLGLIIVDEEHDSSFKQNEPPPYYHARDAAIYLASLHHAKTLLGSATPSIESYFNAKTQKYGLVEMNERYSGVALPEIKLADLKEETRNRSMKSFFSSTLINGIQEALDQHQQVILFQNRRGFSIRLECDKCQWVPICRNCDVSLVYHKHNDQLRCHYCGYSTMVPTNCPACKSPEIKMKGFGTEKIEDELSIFFPNATLARMDLDTTRSKYSYQQILQSFEDRHIDILVGTQMITKGLDFDNVGLVGILSADNLITFPDFRSIEKAFQLLSQVSGRAGRKQVRGKVIIQTWNTQYEILKQVVDNNYRMMFQQQLSERKQFNYPPFFRLVNLTLKHPLDAKLNELSIKLANQLKKEFGTQVHGPAYPLVSRIKGYYLKNILLKFNKDGHLQNNKNRLLEIIMVFQKQSSDYKFKVNINVDPM
ncbi:MAG: primosomal protein N' [Bacteroidota bacterium]